jgi:hypothetical protein
MRARPNNTALRVDRKTEGLTAIELGIFIINVLFAGWFATFILRHCVSDTHGHVWRIVAFLLLLALGFGLACGFWYGLLRCLGFILRRRHLRKHNHQAADTTTHIP